MTISTMAEDRLKIQLTLNGTEQFAEVLSRTSLCDALRDSFRLTGTKTGCEIGVCGTCTVLVDDKPVRGCLMLAVQANGRHIKTVEGLAIGNELHPLQKAFQQNHALQCGFCTSGMLLTALAFLKNKPNPTRDEARDAISGNLCRCTGYETIIDAIIDAAAQNAQAAVHE